MQVTMKQTLFLCLIMGIIGTSCNSSVSRIFSKKTPHEKYAERLKDEGWKKTPEGKQWLAASEKALLEPHVIPLPYKLKGFFHPDKPRAMGLKFTAKQGEQVVFTLTKQAGESFVLYADLYKVENDGTSFLYAADINSSQFNYDINETGSYILRLQPELFKSGEYTLAVAIGPMLEFPVSGNKAKTGSFWGAERDGGKRKHEGIDIFAPKGTPVIAAADGIVTNVSEGGLGGKVVWMRPDGKNISLYYAHLDKQLVHPGQIVKKGDVIGHVGNTGNAKTTLSHLHFGIYTSRGAVDPYPFVNKTIKPPAAVPDKNLTNYLRLTKSQKLEQWKDVVTINTLILPLAVTAKGYIGELPDGKILDLPFTAVQTTNQSAHSKSSAVAAMTGNGSKKK